MKSKLIYSAILFIINTSLVGCGINVNTSLDDKTPELLLTLSFDKVVYQFGDKIRASISLENTGDEGVLINKRMAINSIGPREITLVIIGPAEEKVPSTAFISVRTLELEDFGTLASGENITVSEDIEGNYYFQAGKVYSVFAVYQNTLDPDKYTTAWKGELKSNVVVFEITP